MKALTTNIIILASVAIAVAMYSVNTVKQKDAIDGIEQGLAGLKALPLPSSISFKTEPNNDEVFILARLVMAPLHLSYNMPETKDTLLAIQFISNTDTILDNYIKSRRIVWENKDDKYRYSLSINYEGVQ